MSRRDLSALNHLLYILRQVQKPQSVCHRRTGLAHCGRGLLLGHALHVHQLLISLRLLQGAQVLALEILDKGEEHLLPIGHLTHHRRDLLEPRHSRRPPAPLACDYAVSAAYHRPQQQGLEHAVLGDRFRQFREGFAVKLLSRLVPVRLYLVKAHCNGALVFKAGIFREYSVQSAAQPTFLCAHSLSFLFKYFPCQLPIRSRSL